ncbi:MAG: hypothetical protein RL733_1098, partial [Actinomycetota bacterium]
LEKQEVKIQLVLENLELLKNI